MRKLVYSSILFAVGLIYLQSCNNSGSVLDQTGGLFFGQIESALPRMDTAPSGTISQPIEVESFQVAVDSANGYLLAADRVNNLIQLFDRNGKLLSSMGGEGRGPGEFQSISQLHVGHEGALYVLDGILRRITRFELDNGVLQYDTSFSPEPEGNIRLRDLYVAELGNFGVFHRMDNYETWEESYHLYALDEEFQPIEHLLELPGNEKVKLTETSYLDSFTGTNTYWDLDGVRFYFITSKSPLVHVYNLETGEETTEEYFSLEERENTRWTSEYLSDRMQTMSERYPAYGEAIKNSETLPMFDNFLVSGNRLLFDVFHAGGEGGRIIMVDRGTGEAGYLKMPFHSWRFSLGKDVLYVIESTEERPNIQVLRLM